MKRIVLPTATVATLFLTSAVLYGAGWFTPRSQPAHVAVASHSPRPSESAIHYRQNNASHWRSYVLQP